MLATLRCLALLFVPSPISFHPHNSGRNLLLSHLIGWETEAEQVNLFTVISLYETRGEVTVHDQGASQTIHWS